VHGSRRKDSRGGGHGCAEHAMAWWRAYRVRSRTWPFLVPARQYGLASSSELTSLSISPVFAYSETGTEWRRRPWASVVGIVYKWVVANAS
jgi:hypothetical protein